MGYLTRDPESRFTPAGKQVATGGIGMNRKWKSEAGEEKTETTFVDWTAWGRTAEVLCRYVKKGHLIYLEGRLKLDQWEDKQTGQKRQKTSMVIESFQFLPNGQKEGSDNDGGPTPPPSRAAQPAPQESVYSNEDDVPF